MEIRNMLLGSIVWIIKWQTVSNWSCCSIREKIPDSVWVQNGLDSRKNVPSSVWGKLAGGRDERG